MEQIKSKQVDLARAIFSGIALDKDGYCGCPQCGSRELLHDGSTLDNGYILCLNCHYSIGGKDPYEMLFRWNKIDRDSFQLKLLIF